MKIIDLANQQPITELYAAISIDENGNEGICSAGDNFHQMPIVCGYKRSIDKMHFLIAELSKKSGKKIRIVKFTQREIIEEIFPVTNE